MGAKKKGKRHFFFLSDCGETAAAQKQVAICASRDEEKFVNLLLFGNSWKQQRDP